MTAQTLKKKNLLRQSKFSIDKEKLSLLTNQMKLFSIAIKMKKSGLSDSFIVNSVRVALDFEGVADLMSLWMDETNQSEKNDLVADIQDMIDACEQKSKQEEMYIKFNDLESIAKDIRAFKDSLYQIVVERGGVSKLAELTGIPQPSLSRFFNSNAMPRRATVLAIAKALDLDGVVLDARWSR
jgi:DNA-binding phage protein